MKRKEGITIKLSIMKYFFFLKRELVRNEKAEKSEKKNMITSLKLAMKVWQSGYLTM